MTWARIFGTLMEFCWGLRVLVVWDLNLRGFMGECFGFVFNEFG